MPLATLTITACLGNVWLGSGHRRPHVLGGNGDDDHVGAVQRLVESIRHRQLVGEPEAVEEQPVLAGTDHRLDDLGLAGPQPGRGPRREQRGKRRSPRSGADDPDVHLCTTIRRYESSGDGTGATGSAAGWRKSRSLS